MMSAETQEYLVQRARNIYDKLEKTGHADETRVKLFKEQMIKVQDLG